MVVDQRRIDRANGKARVDEDARARIDDEERGRGHLVDLLRTDERLLLEAR
jgi:hypothetical protein